MANDLHFRAPVVYLHMGKERREEAIGAFRVHEISYRSLICKCALRYFDTSSQVLCILSCRTRQLAAALDTSVETYALRLL